MIVYGKGAAMTEKEKMLLKINNKKNIKEMNHLDVEKEEFDMIKTSLGISGERVSEKKTEEFENKKTKTAQAYFSKYDIVLSEVLEFKIRQIWEIIKKEIAILETEFCTLGKTEFDNIHEFKKFQNHGEDVSYLLILLGDYFRELAIQKAVKDNYNDMILEYDYSNLDVNDLFLNHPFFKGKDLKDYIVSTTESVKLLLFIEYFIEDIVKDLSKEKCTTGADMLMVVVVEIEGLYRYKIKTQQ